MHQVTGLLVQVAIDLVIGRVSCVSHGIRLDHNVMRDPAIDFLRMLIGVITQISIQEANDIYLHNASYSLFKCENDKWHTDTINNFL